MTIIHQGKKKKEKYLKHSGAEYKNKKYISSDEESSKKEKEY